MFFKSFLDAFTKSLELFQSLLLIGSSLAELGILLEAIVLQRLLTIFVPFYEIVQLLCAALDVALKFLVLCFLIKFLMVFEYSVKIVQGLSSILSEFFFPY